MPPKQRQPSTNPTATNKRPRRRSTVEEQQVILPENSVDTACSPILPEAFVDSIVEKVVERIANHFSHIPATSDVPAATGSAAHSPQSLVTTSVGNNASSPTNTFTSASSLSSMQALLSGESNAPSLPSTIFISPSLPIDARVSDKMKSKI